MDFINIPGPASEIVNDLIETYPVVATLNLSYCDYHISLMSNEPRIIAHLEKLYGKYQAPVKSPDFTMFFIQGIPSLDPRRLIALSQGGKASLEPTAAGQVFTPRFEPHHLLPIMLRQPEAWYDSGNIRVIHRLITGVTTYLCDQNAWIVGDLLADNKDINQIFRSLVARMLAQRGYMFMHISVIEWNGCHFALAGDGKLAYAQCLSGLETRELAIDGAFLRMEDGQVSSYPLKPEVERRIAVKALIYSQSFNVERCLMDSAPLTAPEAAALLNDLSCQLGPYAPSYPMGAIEFAQRLAKILPVYSPDHSGAPDLEPVR
ncbi:MAG: hypothetical protein EXR62_09840 [Chloroflexi bacterium]|nr:hypothetical protein [Chloroflexota bacterium]